MTITDRLKLELFVREQLARHPDEFYTQLAEILEKINNEKIEDIDYRGKPTGAFSLRWR